MRTLHGIMDINHDGVISYEDFMLLAEKFGALGHFTPEGLEEFREVMKVIFYFLIFLYGIIFRYNNFSQPGRNNGVK